MFVRLHDFKCTPNTLGGKYSLYIIEIKCQTICTYVNLLINYQTGIQAADLYILNKSFKMVIIFSLQCLYSNLHDLVCDKCHSRDVFCFQILTGPISGSGPTLRATSSSPWCSPCWWA